MGFLTGLGQVVSGDKPMLVEARINESDLQQTAVYIFIAMFLAVLLANFLTRPKKV